MKSATSSMIALLATRQFFTADLYQFSLIGGGTLNYTTGDQDIVWSSTTWSCGGATGPYFQRKGNKAMCHWKIGLEVDTLQIDVMPSSGTINGVPFMTAVRQGALDGAEMTLYRAFMPTYGNTAAGTIIMFVGRVAEIDYSASIGSILINSHLELLNQNMPRNLYQGGCVNTLYDASCTLAQSSFAYNSTIAGTSSTNITMYATVSSGSSYALGKMTFTSGANNGLTRGIKSFSSGSPATITLMQPFPNVPTSSDTFTIYFGCDKQQSTCSSVFNNIANFRGFPYIPEVATAV